MTEGMQLCSARQETSGPASLTKQCRTLLGRASPRTTLSPMELGPAPQTWESRLITSKEDSEAEREVSHLFHCYCGDRRALARS